MPVVLHPDRQSIATYNAIACAANPAAEWRKAMVERKFPTKALPDCGAPTLVDTLTAAIALGDLATPAIYREDGEHVHSDKYFSSDDAGFVRAFGTAGLAELNGNVFTESGGFTVASAFSETVRAPSKQAKPAAPDAAKFLGGILGALKR